MNPYNKPFFENIPKKHRETITKAIKTLLIDAVKFSKIRFKELAIIDGHYTVRTSDPDYSNAFGILQGVYMMLGYTSSGACNDELSPRYWFEQLCKECWNVETFNKEHKIYE